MCRNNRSKCPRPFSGRELSGLELSEQEGNLRPCHTPVARAASGKACKNRQPSSRNRKTCVSSADGVACDWQKSNGVMRRRGLDFENSE